LANRFEPDGMVKHGRSNRLSSAMNHNHTTRDIKSAGKCPECDFDVRKELERKLAELRQDYDELADKANSLAL